MRHSAANQVDPCGEAHIIAASPLVAGVGDLQGIRQHLAAQRDNAGAPDGGAPPTVKKSLPLRPHESVLCGYPSNQLRKIFPPIFDAVGSSGESFVAGIRQQLGGKRCPDDKSFVDALLKQPLYATASRGSRLRMMLERLEESFEHKEPAELVNSQIEHVMPQTLTPEWIRELGDAPQEDHARLLHTLGNLTLTGYNPDLSNKTFNEKRALLKSSHFELNRYFHSVEHWTPAAIEERALSLARRALDIWIDVGRKGLSELTTVVSKQKPVAVCFKGQTHAIRTWKEGAVKLVEMFEAAKPGFLASVVLRGDLVAELSADPKKFVRSKVAIGGVYFNTHASMNELKNRMKKIAKRAGYEESDYTFILAGGNAESTLTNF